MIESSRPPPPLWGWGGWRLRATQNERCQWCFASKTGFFKVMKNQTLYQGSAIFNQSKTLYQGSAILFIKAGRLREATIRAAMLSQARRI